MARRFRGFSNPASRSNSRFYCFWRDVLKPVVVGDCRELSLQCSPLLWGDLLLCRFERSPEIIRRFENHEIGNSTIPSIADSSGKINGDAWLAVAIGKQQRVFAFGRSLRTRFRIDRRCGPMAIA